MESSCTSCTIQSTGPQPIKKKVLLNLLLGPRIIWACLPSLAITFMNVSLGQIVNLILVAKYQATGPVGWLHVRLLFVEFHCDIRISSGPVIGTPCHVTVTIISYTRSE